MRFLLLVLSLFVGCSAIAQGLYQQAGVIHTEVQLFTKNGTQINGSSKEMKINYPEMGSKMEIVIDPKTLLTDNIEFNEQMQMSDLQDFRFFAEVNVSTFEFQSRYNETIEIPTECEINNMSGTTIIRLIVTNHKTNNENKYIIVGKGELIVEDYNLNDVFPKLEGKLKFQFTQNLKVKYN